MLYHQHTEDALADDSTAPSEQPGPWLFSSGVSSLAATRWLCGNNNSCSWRDCRGGATVPVASRGCHLLTTPESVKTFVSSLPAPCVQSPGSWNSLCWGSTFHLCGKTETEEELGASHVHIPTSAPPVPRSLRPRARCSPSSNNKPRHAVAFYMDTAETPQAAGLQVVFWGDVLLQRAFF